MHESAKRLQARDDQVQPEVEFPAPQKQGVLDVALCDVAVPIPGDVLGARDDLDAHGPLASGEFDNPRGAVLVQGSLQSIRLTEYSLQMQYLR